MRYTKEEVVSLKKGVLELLFKDIQSNEASKSITDEDIENEILEYRIANESALKNWLSPEEDEAWKDL